MIDTFHIQLMPAEGSPWGSLEDAADRLQSMDRLAWEPDGSFVWCPEGGVPMYGMIYDSAGEIRYVEIRGDIRPSPDVILQRLREIAGRLGTAVRATDGIRVQSLPDGGVQTFQDFEKSLVR